MKPVAVVVVIFLTATSSLDTQQLTNDQDLSPTVQSNTIFKNRQWMARFTCTFYDQSTCDLSIHVDGRRIDLNVSKSNEDVFVSCYTTTTSIALSISNFTYNDIEDYSCLQDTTQQYNHTWLTAKPYIEVEEIKSPRRVVNLTCNFVPGAPLYWILPGDTNDNTNVQIIDTSNDVNSSTTATIRIDEIHTSQYKCCLQPKDGQFPMTCSSYKLISDDTNVRLVSTSANFTDSKSMFMSCLVQRDSSTPDPQLMEWLLCSSYNSCESSTEAYYAQFSATTVDNDTKTVNTTLKPPNYDNLYSFYKCVCNQSTLHTFEVKLGSRPPLIYQTLTEAYYSNNAHAVKLSCLVSSNPQPTVTWTQTKMLEFSNGTEIITSGGDYSIDTIQISAYEWQTTLFIYPYNVTNHNNIYTCAVENSLGQHSAQLNTNKGPANLDVKLINNTNLSDTTNAIKAVCTYKTFPNLPNYHINVISAETIHLQSETFSWDAIVDMATVEVAFEANVHLYPVTIECTAFNPFNSTSQLNNKIYIDSNTPIS